ncbi:bacterial Ig-like domain-containing protein [Latilactobacillus sp. 5-91]|uniref:bacterial Ig-like domain-containing protein n=1 Tax=Latilactobacillus sp. 5-91 TaxID=3410924 RepID=UPI003C724B6A
MAKIKSTIDDVAADETTTPPEEVKQKVIINVHDSTLNVGDNWDAAYNFDGATDENGKTVNLDQITVSKAVNTSKAGNNNVKYSYGDVTVTAIVTIIDKPEPERDSYIVQHGDNIATVSTAHNVSVGWVKYVNNLSSNRLKPGKTLYFSL